MSKKKLKFTREDLAKLKFVGRGTIKSLEAFLKSKGYRLGKIKKLQKVEQ